MKRTLVNERIRSLVLTAIFIALITAFTFIPQTGYITITQIASITTLHIPVIIGGILLGRKNGLLLGFVFGLGSMIRSFMDPVLHAPFTNPLLSVVPRMFIGFIAHDIHRLFTKLMKKEKLAYPLSLGVVTFLHSITVIPLFYLFVKTGFHFYADLYPHNFEGFLVVITTIFSINSLIEIALAVLVGTPILIALKAAEEKEGGQGELGEDK